MRRHVTRLPQSSAPPSGRHPCRLTNCLQARLGAAMVVCCTLLAATHLHKTPKPCLPSTCSHPPDQTTTACRPAIWLAWLSAALHLWHYTPPEHPTLRAIHLQPSTRPPDWTFTARRRAMGDHGGGDGPRSAGRGWAVIAGRRFLDDSEPPARPAGPAGPQPLIQGGACVTRGCRLRRAPASSVLGVGGARTTSCPAAGTWSD